jgi:hypothetical protein
MIKIKHIALILELAGAALLVAGLYLLLNLAAALIAAGAIVIILGIALENAKQ